MDCDQVDGRYAYVWGVGSRHLSGWCFLLPLSQRSKVGLGRYVTEKDDDDEGLAKMVFKIDERSCCGREIRVV